jgi:DNA-directed RNA polymerase specialized sigma24 family protein
MKAPIPHLTEEDLRLCAALGREAENLRESLQRLRAMAEDMRPHADGMPRGGGPGDPVGQAVADLDALRARWQKTIAAYTRHVRLVEAAIQALPDPDVRSVLRLRFLDGLTWDQIAERTHFVDRWCRELSRRGVRRLTGAGG